MKRVGTQQNRIRVSRIRHAVNFGWYVACREGMIGPFIPRQVAVEAMNKYKRLKMEGS